MCLEFWSLTEGQFLNEYNKIKVLGSTTAVVMIPHPAFAQSAVVRWKVGAQPQGWKSRAGQEQEDETVLGQHRDRSVPQDTQEFMLSVSSPTAHRCVTFERRRWDVPACTQGSGWTCVKLLLILFMLHNPPLSLGEFPQQRLVREAPKIYVLAMNELE